MERRRSLQSAQAEEKLRRYDSAYLLYIKAKAPQAAARVLATTGRYAQAGQLLLTSIEFDSQHAAKLDGQRRKQARLAASYLSRAGNTEEAVRILCALDEYVRAADLLERQGNFLGAERLRNRNVTAQSQEDEKGSRATPERRESSFPLESARRLELEGKADVALQAYMKLNRPGDAARVLQGQGRLTGAAQMYLAAGMPCEAGICFFKAGESGTGLEAFLQVPKDDDRYRIAAIYVAHLTAQDKRADYRRHHFLADFVRTGPVDAREPEYFYQLALAYESQGQLENAKEVLCRLLERTFGYRDAAARLQSVQERMSSGSTGSTSAKRTTPPPTNGPPSPPEADPDFPDLPPLDQVRADSGGSGPESLEESTVLRTAKKGDRKDRDQAGSDDDDPTNRDASHEPFFPGAVIADRYRIEEKIGEGGMAIVFRATDLEIQEQTALKVLLQQVLSPDGRVEMLARVRQELKLCRRLQHPNIVRLYDIRVHRGRRYISMELLEGHTLSALLRSQIDPRQAVDYVIQACAGLQAAHNHGIVHRDIKPSNLFVTSGNVLKVMDFGIARDVMGTRLTRTGMMIGTPGFMAPEQIDGPSKVTPAADLYSLGLVAYKMLTRRLPFEHKEIVPLLMMKLRDVPSPPSQHNPTIPEELDAVILRLLERAPEKRFHSAAEVADRFQDIRSRLC